MTHRVLLLHSPCFPPHAFIHHICMLFISVYCVLSCLWFMVAELSLCYFFSLLSPPKEVVVDGWFSPTLFKSAAHNESSGHWGCLRDLILTLLGHEAGLSPALIFNSRETANYTINIIFYSVRLESNGWFIFSQRHKFPLGSCDEEHPASNYQVFSFSWFSAQPGVSVLQAKNPDLRLITVWSCSESSFTHSADAPRHTGSGVPSRKLLMEIKFVAKQHRPKCSLLENNLLVARQHYLIGCAWRSAVRGINCFSSWFTLINMFIIGSRGHGEAAASQKNREAGPQWRLTMMTWDKGKSSH